MTLCLCMYVCAMGLTSCSHSQNSKCDNIATLDSLLDRHTEFERAKLIRIAALESKKNHAVSLTDRYLANSLLFDEYIIYQSDSAMKYVNQNLHIAAASGNKYWEIQSMLDKAETLTATGLLSQSESLMKSIDRKSLPDDMLADYYGQMIFLYSHMGNYAGGSTNDFYVKERIYKDSIMTVIDKKHPDYLWYKGWDVLGTKRSCSEVIQELINKLENSDLNQRQDAKNAYALAKLYEWTGDKDNYKKYMALSAIVDVKIANAEISSLEELANIMFEENDIDRAYSYINYSLNKAIAFPNRVKAYGISEKLDVIQVAYQEKSQKQHEHIQLFLTLLCALTVILAIAIITIMYKNSKQKHQEQVLDETNANLSLKNSELAEAQKQLNAANEQLKEVNANLLQKNEELKESNYVKEQYIVYVFTICSSYINKIEELKRNIHRKAVTKRYKEIEAETSMLDMKDELKEFYSSFDSVFLHIYPDFVSDFNTLLQEDQRILPKDGELLNTVLRIYALIRLGITDSVKIADFLHCSVQTVYNNRFKVRNKAATSKTEFAEKVRTLGKYQNMSS